MPAARIVLRGVRSVPFLFPRLHHRRANRLTPTNGIHFLCARFDSCGALDCSIGFSFRGDSPSTGCTLATSGLGAGETLVFSTRARFFSRSAASAPAMCICSIVGKAAADFFFRSGAFFAGACIAGSAAFGFVSRGSMTSCARICPAMAKLQSNAVNAFLPMKRARDK